MSLPKSMQRKVKFPDHLEKAIVNPHEHETAGHSPLWILWRHAVGSDGIPDVPRIDCICDSEDTTRYNLAAIFESYPSDIKDKRMTIFVERIPANHRFASSLSEQFVDSTLSRVRKSLRSRYRRDGD